MHKGDEHKTSGELQLADAHYFALTTIIEQAKALGLELDGLMSPERGTSGSDTIPVARLGELIKQARKKLYLQMMEFELLDMDLAELHAELCNTPEKPAVTLTLV